MLYCPSFSPSPFVARRQVHPNASDGLLSCALQYAFKWIGDFPWEEIKELNQLSSALARQPLLRSPSVIAHILTNKDSDAVCKKSSGLNKVLELLRFCLAVPVPLAKNPDEPTPAEEDAYFGNAIRATKAWFHRRHGISDDDDDDDDGVKSGGTGAWGWTTTFSYTSAYKKQKSPAQRKVLVLLLIITPVCCLLTFVCVVFRHRA